MAQSQGSSPSFILEVFDKRETYSLFYFNRSKKSKSSWARNRFPVMIPSIGVAISLYKEAFFKTFDSVAVNQSHDSDRLNHPCVHPFLNYREIKRKKTIMSYVISKNHHKIEYLWSTPRSLLFICYDKKTINSISISVTIIAVITIVKAVLKSPVFSNGATATAALASKLPPTGSSPPPPTASCSCTASSSSSDWFSSSTPLVATLGLSWSSSSS